MKSTASAGRSMARCIVLSLGATLVAVLAPFAVHAASMDLVHEMRPGDPQDVRQPLTAHPNGLLYGVSNAGGDHRHHHKFTLGGGAVFEVATDGSLRLLHSFHTANGLPTTHSKEPQALTVGADGSLFGTTFNGGQAGDTFGSIFHVTLDGSFQSIQCFPRSPTYPYSQFPYRLLLGEDGALYGSTGNGLNDHGSVYRIQTDGSGFTTLHSFVGSTEGHPVGGLTWFDGNFYGMTADGGVNLAGSIYRVSPSGSYQLLYSFAPPKHPQAELTVGPDGHLYGVYAENGRYHGGVFKMTLAGDSATVRTLHRFHRDTDGRRPGGGVTVGADGRLYGTTLFATPYNHGALYAVSTDGDFETLLRINHHALTGDRPLGGLTLGTDGELYGATAHGGLHKGHNGEWWGSIYHLALP